jgi:hypothetical protein
MYSVYGCLEYTLLHDPKSANFTTSPYKHFDAQLRHWSLNYNVFFILNVFHTLTNIFSGLTSR